MADEQNRTHGWRTALSTINMGFRRPGRQDFTMRSAIENRMTNEDLGKEATKQDWTGLDTLREQLKWWESTTYCLGHPAKERNRWTLVPSQGQERKKPRSSHRGRGGEGKTKAIYCFHPSTRVQIFTPDKRVSEYKRMDKLVK